MLGLSGLPLVNVVKGKELMSGQMIGGAVTNPAETMPSLFRGGVWEKYPYLLPSVATALLPAGAAVACFFWLPEVSNVFPPPSSSHRLHQ